MNNQKKSLFYYFHLPELSDSFLWALCQWSSSNWTLFIFMPLFCSNPKKSSLQWIVPGIFARTLNQEEYSHVNKFSAIHSPTLVQHPQGLLPQACSGSCLYEFDRIFGSFSKLFPTGAGMYFPSCLSQSLALVILETVEVRADLEDKTHITRQGSGKVFSSVLAGEWFSSTKGKKAGSALL